MTKKFEYMCDMGSIKIMLKGGSLFFMNDFGDGIYDVFICKEKDIPKKSDFKGHFTIFTEGYLMASDCDNDQKMYKFTKGRYFVSLDLDKTTFYIYKVDEDINA